MRREPLASTEERDNQEARASVLVIVCSTSSGSRSGGRWSIPGTRMSSQPGMRAAAALSASISGAKSASPTSSDVGTAISVSRS